MELTFGAALHDRHHLAEDLKTSSSATTTSDASGARARKILISASVFGFEHDATPALKMIIAADTFAGSCGLVHGGKEMSSTISITDSPVRWHLPFRKARPMARAARDTKYESLKN